MWNSTAKLNRGPVEEKGDRSNLISRRRKKEKRKKKRSTLMVVNKKYCEIKDMKREREMEISARVCVCV